ncbi:MAG: GNAT family N-acetyltransferase [Candidatus Parcubacteria bacterium]|nr:GNAT family N-acetyltransferase [Candidatus Parcubacteria bacterium]
MTIKTKEFILRPYKMTDAQDVARNINDMAIIRCLALNIYPYKLKDAKIFLKRHLLEEKKKNPDSQSFVIEINGEAVGSIGLHKIVKGHKASIGYWLAKKYWGQGIMTKVVKLVTAFAFKQYKLKRIYARVYLFNMEN